MVNIIKNKKTKVIESPKQVQVPRQELPAEVLPAKIKEALAIQNTGHFAANTLTPEQQAIQDKRMAGFPDIQRGKLKPEFQTTEDIARRSQELGKLSVEQRLSPDNFPVQKEFNQFETQIPTFSELKATAVGILRGIGLKFKVPGGINVREDTTMADTDGLTSKAMAIFKSNPTDENAINALNIIQISEDALVQQRGQAKITATAESLISGDISTYEYELEQNIKATNNLRQSIANTLRAGINQRIISQRGSLPDARTGMTGG